VEDAPQQNRDFVYARFVLNAVLTGKDGAEVLSFSANDRVGHTSQEEARQRAIRKAEEIITDTDFAKEFDAWFSSLL
jgi:bisphosphoglycerate-independent phosphoglycerate mutase (AlkP superfamily)